MDKELEDGRRVDYASVALAEAAGAGCCRLLADAEGVYDRG